MRIGIMSAMQEENNLLARSIFHTNTLSRAQREYTIGSLMGHDIFLVFSRWGKVAAAIIPKQPEELEFRLRQNPGLDRS